jgi:hypothetical protein
MSRGGTKMKGTIYIFDRPGDVLVAIRAADVDEGGNIIDPVFLEAMRRGGWVWTIQQDMGLAAIRHREATGGFGWGGRPRPIQSGANCAP